MSRSDPSTPNADGASTLRRAARNFGKLLRGRGVAAVLELLTVALLARKLSPTPFGQLVLIQTYVLAVRGLLNFKLYEVAVRFGVPQLEAGNTKAFKQLLRICFLLDTLSSVFAAAIAIVIAPLVGRLLGWEADTGSLAMIYSIALLSYGFGTAKGVLRIYDRYDVLGWQIMVAPVLRLAGVLLVMVTKPTLFMFVIALTLTTALGNIYLIVMGWIELHRQVGPIAFHGPALRGWRDTFSGLVKFMFIVYWQGNVDMLPRHITTLLAGTYLGAAGAGLLRLAREATKVLSKPGALLRQVLFPDMVRMWTRQSPDFAVILTRSLLVSLAAGVVLTTASVFGGSWLLSAALGEAYAKAAPLMSLLLFAATLELMATVLRSAGYAMGHAGAILRLNLAALVIYLASFVVLTRQVGLLGPGIAACLAPLLPLVGTAILAVGCIRRQHASLS